MTREEMISSLVWLDEDSGLCMTNMGASYMWSDSRPGPDRPDLVSVVALRGPTDKYTDEELAEIVAFSQRVTAKYDAMFRWRLGCNLQILDKPDYPPGKWIRKRLSWTEGVWYSDNLTEAIAALER